MEDTASHNTILLQSASNKPAMHSSIQIRAAATRLTNTQTCCEFEQNKSLSSSQCWYSASNKPVIQHTIQIRVPQTHLANTQPCPHICGLKAVGNDDTALARLH